MLDDQDVQIEKGTRGGEPPHIKYTIFLLLLHPLLDLVNANLENFLPLISLPRKSPLSISFVFYKFLEILGMLYNSV